MTSGFSACRESSGGVKAKCRDCCDDVTRACYARAEAAGWEARDEYAHDYRLRAAFGEGGAVASEIGYDLGSETGPAWSIVAGLPGMVYKWWNERMPEVIGIRVAGNAKAECNKAAATQGVGCFQDCGISCFRFAPDCEDCPLGTRWRRGYTYQDPGRCVGL